MPSAAAPRHPSAGSPARELSSSHRFTGFSRATFAFFKDLAAHNNREWLQARKAMFEETCQAPLKALTAALDPPFGSERISRISRDIRFSKDKSPYHTHISTRIAGCVMFLSADGLYVGTGIYLPDPPTLRKLREAVNREASGRALVTLVAALRRKGYTVTSHESLASAPRGFHADHPRLELLRMKDIHAGRTLKPANLSTTATVARVNRIRADVTPLREWLLRYVGNESCV